MPQLSERPTCLKSGSLIFGNQKKWDFVAYYKVFIYIGICYVIKFSQY